jgi:DNA topoisomerase-3
MKLIIAEKPSVAQDIASALKVSTKKNGYFESQEYKISWCFGHLISLSSPEKYDPKYKKWCFENLPIIPNNFKTEIITEKEKQFYILKDLMHQCDEIICATDAGREGELIFRLVYKQANCSKKFKRLWISSMTEEAILQGMKNLKNGDHYDSLFWSAFSRARADWLIGMNASQLFSLKYNQKFSCGRVQTPTLNLIVKRHQEIINFNPEDYYIIKCFFDGFESTWFNDNGNKIKDKKEADHIKNKCNLLRNANKIT